MQETQVQSLVWEGTKPICGCLVTQLCPTHCKRMECSMLGFLVLHYLLEFAQTHVYWADDAIQPSHSLSSTSPPAFIFPSIRFFPVGWLFASGGQSTGYSASVSVLPMNIQGWFPLELTWSPSSSRDSQESFPTSHFKSMNSTELSVFMVQISPPYMIAGKTVALTIQTFLAK